jgi:NAD(P)-dependent dehydrogenase (short-subunit alcohol dehydrogenase family)
VSLFDLTGKAAIVTGSSRGIGRAIVERMAEHGARVVVSSRHVEPCREVAAAINARLGEGRAIAIAANISANEQLQALVEETVRAPAVFEAECRTPRQMQLVNALPLFGNGQYYLIALKKPRVGEARSFAPDCFR